MNKITTLHMEVSLARKFNYNQNLIVPNISYGLGIHECDLLILTKHNYATEIEIKISVADLKKDSEKRHQHLSNKIRRLFFAIPEFMNLDNILDLIPERAGIVVVNRHEYKYDGKVYFRCSIIRAPKINKNAEKFSDKDRLKMGHLAAMRIWGLKRKIKKLEDRKYIQTEINF